MLIKKLYNYIIIFLIKFKFLGMTGYGQQQYGQHQYGGQQGQYGQQGQQGAGVVSGALGAMKSIFKI